MSDIFISYKREEQNIARKLASNLEEKGWSVWWDPNLQAGERVDDAIQSALANAKCVIVLWSNMSIGSEYVKDEASYGLRRNKLLPIAIENVDLPFRFEGIHTVSLIDWNGSSDSPGLQEVCKAICNMIGAPSGNGSNSTKKNTSVDSIEPILDGRNKAFDLTNINNNSFYLLVVSIFVVTGIRYVFRDMHINLFGNVSSDPSGMLLGSIVALVGIIVFIFKTRKIQTTIGISLIWVATSVSLNFLFVGLFQAINYSFTPDISKEYSSGVVVGNSLVVLSGLYLVISRFRMLGNVEKIVYLIGILISSVYGITTMAEAF